MAVDTGPYQFDFSTGQLALDFTKTLTGRAKAQPIERLTYYDDLVSWGRQAGALTDLDAQRLLREARRRPGRAQAVLERAITLRESLYQVLVAAIARSQPPQPDFERLNLAVADALGHLRLVSTGEGFAWGWDDREERLGQVVWCVARAAAELLTSDELSRVRMCAEQSCGWLFLDASRNRSRQWCDMKVCGNRAKARRHYARTKQGR